MASSTKAARARARTHAPTGRGRAAQPVRGAQAARPQDAIRHGASDLVVLGPALTIAEVAQAARGFTTMLAGGTAHTDARALESIDTAGLQLLLAAAAAAQERGLKLSLRGAPELLAGAAHALGVDGDLAVAMELSA